jgi:xanthine dehydrogenase YagR molybdenum-binding subunit
MIGKPLPRPDGREKVTGRAKYTADYNVPDVLHAVLVTATIPAGRISKIDIDEALSESGVERVLTHQDMPKFGRMGGPPTAQSLMPMQSNQIRYEGQPVAMVLANTLEAAEAGARKVFVHYKATKARLPSPADWARLDAAAVAPKKSDFLFFEPEFSKADADTELVRSAHRIETVYFQPSRHHNAMEPSAVLAEWDGDALTVHDSTQHVYGVRQVLATRLKLPVEKIRVIAQHTGGGFGAKGWVWPHEVLAAAAARLVGRPVKLVLSRANCYSCLGYQPRIAQRMELGVDAAARLRAVVHDVINITSISDDFVEFSTEASKSLYATASMHLKHRVERANVAMPTPMRAPVEGPGTWALESAMDELAYLLRMDPLDLRLLNYAEVDPASGKPWSSKKLREAYEEGARLFGWRERPREPQRDGAWIVGQGMAGCTMGVFRMPSKAEVRLNLDGTAIVTSGYQDIGTGTLTIMPQIAAAVLGLDLDQVASQMGDTRLPEAGPTYGSSSTMGVGGAVLRAAEDVRGKLARLANLPPDEVEMIEGQIRRKGAREGTSIADVLREADVEEIVGYGTFNPEDSGKGLAMRTFGAVFVEVGVDPELGLLRLRRAVGSYSAGRIVNPRTAKAQMTGGIIWGWGMAAMEQSEYETVFGRFLSKNLAGVAIPVNADIPAEITIHFVDEVDEHASPIGGKGIGELSATGVAAAVANAVFHATGRRIRELPITPMKLVTSCE